MEVWNGKPADYSSLRVFGCPVYVMYNSQERTKLDPKSRKCIFLGYADNVKGYRLWDPTAHKKMNCKMSRKNDSTTKDTTIVKIEKKTIKDESKAKQKHKEQKHEEQKPNKVNDEQAR
ncbi:hypothetical protein CR513_23595, partial [Mucuna pruriens]